MPKYLVQFSYTGKGFEGVLKEGGSGRREAVRKLAESLGGSLEAFYFSFGEHDGFAILDMPDNVSLAAALMTVGGSGAASTETTVLMTAEEADEAIKRRGSYRPPGR